MLDFSRVLAGPICGRALRDLGADVVKVEPPAGDLSRFAYPKVGSIALYYTQQNAGKRNLSLDLTRPEARDLLVRLATRADVVVENFRPGVMERAGLDYTSLSAANPRLVYASISGYGQDGPWADRRAYAVITQAEMGMTAGSLAHHDRLASDGGGPSRFPANEPYSHADVYAGLLALSAVVAALYQRERTGRGQHIDVSMAQSLLFANEHVQAELAEVESPGRIVSLAPGDSPVCETGSGELVTIAGHPCGTGMFERYCQAMGREDLREDPRFVDEAARLAHHQELDAVVRDWVRSHDDAHVLERTLAEVGLAMGVVRTVPEVAASDWASQRGAIAEVDDRAGGTVRIPQAPWRFSDASAEARGGPAYRGEHNREVLADLLGIEAAELDRLEAAGVLSSRLPARR